MGIPEDEEMEALARQLACPEGEPGLAVATAMNENNAPLIARCIATLAPAAGESIAEIGVGNGELSRPIVEALGPGGHFIGVERSALMAEQALLRLRPGAGGCRVTLLNLDCHHAPLEEASLDGLLAVNLLYFIEDLPTLLARLANWLRPSGRLVFGLRSPETLRQMPFTRFGFALRGEDELRAALQGAGFIDIHIDHYDEGTVQFAGRELRAEGLVLRAVRAA